MSDLGSAMSDSLSRSGAGGMLAPLKHIDGTNLLPSMTFLNDVTTGAYLDVAGTMTFAAAGTALFRVSSANGVQIWDGANWRGVSTGTPFAGIDPNLVNNDSAIIVGTDDPTNEPHMTAGPTTWQAKTNMTTAGLMEINPLGGPVNLGPQTGVGELNFYQDGNLRLSFNTGPLPIGMTLNENGGTCAVVFNDAANLVNLGYVGFLGSNLNYYNENNGALQIFTCEDSVGTPLECLNLDPAKYTAGAAATVPRLQITGYWDGQDIPTYGPSLFFATGTGAPYPMEMAADYISAGGDFHIQKFGGGDAVLGASDSGTGGVALYHDTSNVANTDTPANGGLFVNNTATGAGLERVLTESDGYENFVVTTALTVNNDISDPIPGWTFVMAPNTRYRIRGMYMVTDNASIGVNVSFSVTSGVAVFSGVGFYNKDNTVNAESGIVRVSPGGNFLVVSPGGTSINITYDIQVSTAGGATIQADFGQRVATVGDTILSAGSNMEVSKLGDL